MTPELERMKEIAKNWAVSDNADRSLLISWYKRRTGNNPQCLSCPGKLEAYGHQILSYINHLTRNNMSINDEWKLKSSGLIPVEFGSSEFISNSTMTEDKALRFLSVNPNRIKVFDTYPSDWMQRLQGGTAEAAMIEEVKPKSRRKKDANAEG